MRYGGLTTVLGAGRWGGMVFWGVPVLLALILTCTPSEGAECPECDGHRQWLEQNSGSCGYHGARLPSICAADPECLRWNEDCRARGEALEACLQACRMPSPPPESAAADCGQCGVFQDWLDANADQCHGQGARLPSICSSDPVCQRWTDVCARQRRLRDACRTECADKGPEEAAQIAPAGDDRVACAVMSDGEGRGASGDTPLAPVFPDVQCSDCEAAFDAARQLIEERDVKVGPYLELAGLEDRVIRARVYTVTIHSEHGQELKAKLQIRDEDLASMRSVKSKLFYVTDVLAVNIPLVGYAAKRASDIVDLMTEHPNESLPVDEAVAKVKRLHAERERLIADLRGFKRDQYCREILPYELTLSSLYTRALSAESCGDERRSADMRIKLERLGQIRWEQIPQESPDLPDRMSGRHPQFYTWLRLLHRVVDCRNEGIDVDPAPVPAVKGRL